LKTLYGNTYLDRNARATPENQFSILEAFADNWQKMYDALAAGRIPLADDCTNQQFHKTCKAWLAVNS